MRVRKATTTDENEWLRMRTELWPDSVGEHQETTTSYFKGNAKFVDHVLFCENDANQLVGFVELRIRNYAEGSESIEVPYIEGWYVDSSSRRLGVGALLIQHAELWAPGLGYLELASDAEIDNHGSIAAHLSLGFEEVERSVCFIKRL